MFAFIIFYCLFQNINGFAKISPKECPDKNYFDISHLTCNPCEDGNAPTADRNNILLIIYFLLINVSFRSFLWMPKWLEKTH